VVGWRESEILGVPDRSTDLYSHYPLTLGQVFSLKTFNDGILDDTIGLTITIQTI